MKLAPALLEEWMRTYYFAADFDIGSSGVENFSIAQLRELLGFSLQDLDSLVLMDSETLGGAGVRQAVADHLVGGRTDHVMVTHGSTEANFLIMQGLLEPGDEVLVLDPIYQQLSGVAAAMGCTLRSWPLRWENRWRPDFAELEELLGERTRMVVVNFPHNPTGVSITQDEQRRLIAAVDRVGAYLVWDGAFARLPLDGRAPLPEPLDYPRAVSMGTMSKAYGLPGLRVGWCLAAPAVLERFIRIRDYLTLHLSPLVEIVAQKALEKADVLLRLRLEQAGRNLDLVARWIDERAGRVEWVRPWGGVSAFVRFEPGVEVEELCHRLAREERVLLVPGNCFGHPDHARLGFGGPSSVLQEGLDRLARRLDTAGPKES
ncbi:MAG TPA: capreomycidine synthase [Acidobacteria bacterium]|nr:capreomycidine synthase [Acidobacteriota bacterium]